MRYFFALLLLTTSLHAAQGNVTHSFKEGKVQFLSEKAPNGEIVCLLKPMKPNTTVNSIKIEKNTISFLMMVKEDNPICASWTDAQPVVMVLDPKPVNKITLTGKTTLSVGNVTILAPMSSPTK